MKFGVREICDVVFKAKSAGEIGSYSYSVGQPVLYIDSAKASTIEGSGSTVYATGGRGNSKLIAWEGEKSLTFTVEDALLSPVGFAILSGAGLMDAAENKAVKVHCSTASATMSIDATGAATIDLTEAMPTAADELLDSAPVFVMMTDADGSLTGQMLQGFTVATKDVEINGVTVQKKHKLTATSSNLAMKGDLGYTFTNSSSYNVFVDFYVNRTEKVTQLTIDAENFAGYYYVEASTLFRRQHDGVDLPAEIVFPNVKIQSNFTFSMASTGDPSTFTFTMDAMPGYTVFDSTKKVLCAIQIVNDTNTEASITSGDSLKD